MPKSNLRKNAGAGLLILIALTAIRAEDNATKTEMKPAKITLTSPKMRDGQPIPTEFTAEGRDVSPPLEWKDLPKGTAELALICDDPDAPTPQPWVHWILYAIPAGLAGLPEAIPSDAELKKPEALAGTKHGRNGWGKPGYRGPAPPPGKPHRYHFRLYALDRKLDLPAGANKEKLLEAMKGHILGEGLLIATHER